jgi:hypothetical protein
MAGGCFEGGTFIICEGERLNQARNGVSTWMAAHAALQVIDTPPGKSSAFGQLLLGQASGSAVVAQ